MKFAQRVYSVQLLGHYCTAGLVIGFLSFTLGLPFCRSDSHGWPLLFTSTSSL